MKGVAIDCGLSSADAAARLKAFGPNELPNPDRRNFARIVFDVMRQPMFALLLGGGAVYLLLGEPIDAAVLALLKRTGVDPASIDRVFLTGGTSFVPAVRRLFTSRFGAEKIQTGDEFTSIAQGLALQADQR